MRHIFTFVFCLSGLFLAAQANLVFSGAGMVMGSPYDGNNIFIVIGNPDSDAIQMPLGIATSGGIVSEDENHVVKWMTGDNPSTGSGYPNNVWYVPFLSLTGGGIPEQVASELSTYSGGLAGGSVSFSTYATPASDNLPWPSDVTHLNNYNGPVDNSANVVNRFWCIDASDQGASIPDVSIRLRYDEDELDGVSESELLMQRFNAGTAFWMDFVDFSVPIDAANNIVGPWTIPSAEFHKSWTLSKSSNPLPIDLLYFDAVCADRGKVLLSWATASEQDNKEFVLERSEDGIIWEEFEVVVGSGNSSAEIRYEVYDNNPFDGLTYYQLTQVDFDGTSETFDPTVSDCEGVGFELVSAYERDEMIILDVSSGMEDAFDIQIFDLQGKVVASSINEVVYMGRTLLQLDKGSMSSGIYTIRMQSENNMATRKIFLN